MRAVVLRGLRGRVRVSFMPILSVLRLFPGTMRQHAGLLWRQLPVMSIPRLILPGEVRNKTVWGGSCKWLHASALVALSLTWRKLQSDVCCVPQCCKTVQNCGK